MYLSSLEKQAQEKINDTDDIDIQIDMELANTIMEAEKS